MIKGFEKTLPEYSAQQMMDCDMKNYGCSGGWMASAFQYSMIDGVMSSKNYNNDAHYEGKQGECKYNPMLQQFKNQDYEELFASSNSKIKEIVSQQPIIAGIYFNTKMALYEGGVMTEDYMRCSDPTNEINHAVLIVGYGKN